MENCAHDFCDYNTGYTVYACSKCGKPELLILHERIKLLAEENERLKTAITKNAKADTMGNLSQWAIDVLKYEEV